MGISGDNLTKMSNCFTLDKPIGSAQDIRIRFNLEFLKGCEFHCPGCFVNRNNSYNSKDLDIVYNAQQSFKENGYVFDEIILGPTDFFSAYNTKELITNPNFSKLFEKDTVLTILSTLQSDEEVIKERIDLVNKYIDNGIEIEILIPFEYDHVINDDDSYFSSLRSKIDLLNRFNCHVEYAFQLNIQNIKDPKNFDLKKISDKMWSELGSITEFNPSFMRTSSEHLVLKVIQSWNEMLRLNITKDIISGDDKVTFTMANKNHAGFNEITYNFSNGSFYSCPFIYENVFDKGDSFLIECHDSNGFYDLSDFLTHRDFINKKQMDYLSQTTECESCSHSISCVSKQVIDYMMDKDIKDCIVAKDVLNLF